ncbi:MAG: metal dependent phosphohydrolase [Promethearchaeota archaeon CR_4]|nr:MAG: metal dependent phosphohydrolase [Candidatus Lokiarchaeota archaeon CR_4]
MTKDKLISLFLSQILNVFLAFFYMVHSGDVQKMAKDNLPTWERALEILQKLNLPDHIIDHVKQVARQATFIARKVRKIPVNVQIVQIGALFHDIGRSRIHGFLHGVEGGKILREMGMPEELARIAERHILGGFTKEEATELDLPQREFLPETVEEKIVCLADKMVNGSQNVTVNKRFDRWFKKYGKTALLVSAQKRVKGIEREIHHLT